MNILGFSRIGIWKIHNSYIIEAMDFPGYFFWRNAKSLQLLKDMVLKQAGAAGAGVKRYLDPQFVPFKKQGLVNVPFWEYWTSPYSSHYRPYT